MFKSWLSSTVVLVGMRELCVLFSMSGVLWLLFTPAAPSSSTGCNRILSVDNFFLFFLR